MTMKKRPKYIEAQIKEANEIFRAKKLRDENRYDDTLWMWLVNHLLHHGWYRGYNMYVNLAKEGEEPWLALAGPDFKDKDHFVQIW